MTRVVVLLPPSEGKAAGGHGPRTPGAFADLESYRVTVREGLQHRGFDAARQLRVGPGAVAAATAANRETDTAPALPALRRYTGVLYRALDYPAQPVPLRRRLTRSVVVVSGRWGLLRGDDPVPAYKLPIGAIVPGLGGLARWWRPRLTPVLTEHVRGAVVWNLLPGAYAAAVGQLDGVRAIWSVQVVREAAGRRTVVGHDSKAVKGALTRALVAAGATTPSALDGWEGPAGYRLGEESGGLLTVVTSG